MGTKKFTVDGRPFAYRDPNNPKYTNDNPHSYGFTNPLYEYDEATVKKAAKKVGIQNVDEREEVSRILDFIRGSGPEPKTEDEIIPSEPTPEVPEDDYGAPGPVDFETRMEEATYPPFAGSYFDFVGGDPSNPSDYYLGDPTRGGSTRYFQDSVVEDPSPAGVVPQDQPSFMRSITDPDFLDAAFSALDEATADDEDLEYKTYETEEDRVSQAVAGGLPTIQRMFGTI